MGTKRAFGHHNVTRRPDTDKRVTVWLAMRQLVRFDVATLVMTTEAAKRSVEDFVYAIAKAGYLRKQRVKSGPTRGSKFVWQLVRDTGPRCPITKGNGNVHDQNTDKVYAPGGAEVIDQGARDAG